MRCACAVVAVATAAILFLAPPAKSSGFHPPMASFVSLYRPDPPLQRFAAGQLGLIQPNWDTTYQYVVYRYLAGPGFDSDEQKVLLSIWNAPHEPLADWSARDGWIAARAKIPGAPAIQTIDVFARGPAFTFFRNCNDDAFSTATATLAAMTDRFGASSAQAQRWLDAQDIVFQNCPGSKKTPHIPGPLSDGTAFERAQRAYQIACANFYGQNFDAAAAMFTAIAADSSSPWRTLAPYLVARTTIRKATLSGVNNDDALLAQADSELRSVVSGSPSADLRASALGLLGFVGCRLHPQEREVAEVRAIMRPHSAGTLAQNFKDYQECGTPGEGTPPLTSRIVDGVVVYHGNLYADDLDDWLSTIRDTGLAPTLGPDMHTHSIDKWHRMRSLPWLIASLAQTPASDPEATELITAAMRVPRGSPGFVTMRFHAARVLIERGKTEQARAMLDAMLVNRSGLPRSAANGFAWLRLKLARNLDEFLTYAMRYPIGVAGDELADQFADPFLQQLAAGPMFDVDGAEAMDRWMPLSVLKQAAGSPILPGLADHGRVKRLAESGPARRSIRGCGPRTGPLRACPRPQARAPGVAWRKDNG